MFDGLRVEIEEGIPVGLCRDCGGGLITVSEQTMRIIKLLPNPFTEAMFNMAVYVVRGNWADSH